MLTFRRPSRSLLVFLGLVVGVGAVLGHVVDALGVAATAEVRPAARVMMTSAVGFRSER